MGVEIWNRLTLLYNRWSKQTKWFDVAQYQNYPRLTAIGITRIRWAKHLDPFYLRWLGRLRGKCCTLHAWGAPQWRCTVGPIVMSVLSLDRMTGYVQDMLLARLWSWHTVTHACVKWIIVSNLKPPACFHLCRWLPQTPKTPLTAAPRQPSPYGSKTSTTTTPHLCRTPTTWSWMSTAPMEPPWPP